LPLRSVWPGVVLGMLAATFLSFYMPLVAKRFPGHSEVGTLERP
jgi:hypothetical protein